MEKPEERPVSSRLHALEEAVGALTRDHYHSLALPSSDLGYKAFINDLLRTSIFSKAVFILIIASIVALNHFIELAKWVSGTSGSEQGVKAAIYALATASILFVGLIPERYGRLDIILTILSKVVAAVSTFGAGWYWLRSEIGESTLGSYVVLGIFAAIVLSTSLVMGEHIGSKLKAPPIKPTP